MSKSLLENLQKAIALNPQFADGHFAMGNLLRDQNNLNAAIASYQKAIHIKPDFEAAYLSIGQILSTHGKFNEAIGLYRNALIKLPNSIQINLLLGDALYRIRQFPEAIASLEKTLLLDSNCVQAYASLGIVLVETGKMTEAVTAYKRLVELIPKETRSWMLLGDTYNRLGKVKEAIDCWQQAIAINPNYVIAHQLILSHNGYLPNYSREQNFADHVAFGEHFEKAWRGKWTKTIGANSQKRLRVGFVSHDLRNHPVGYFLENVLRELRHHNHIDIIVYPTNPTIDAVTNQIRQAAHQWVPAFQLSDDALEKRIRDDKIDILVDLSGHNYGNRLLVFVRKPAPIQVTWLAYWDTTGLKAMDYILCDHHALKEDEAKFFVEKPWYLPNTRLCLTPPNESVNVALLPALTRGYITFGNFNYPAKMTDRVVAVWARVLKQIPRARLLFKWETYCDAAIRQEVIDRFAAEDISAERLEFQAASPFRDYLLAYNDVDIALDPFPFPGGTTSVHGMWMGVPMIALRGNQIISRQGESILNNVDLQDWIAQDEDDYVELAVKKSTDLAALSNLRNQLRARLEASPLCDAKAFALNLENAFTEMWKRLAV